MSHSVDTLPKRAGKVLILAVIAVLFTALDDAFIFTGAYMPYVTTTLPLFLFSSAVLMAVLGALSKFRCLYTGFQDEAVVILAGVAAGFARHAGGVVDDRLYVSTIAMIVIATLVTGLFFLLLGTLRLGRFVRYVPFSVTAGLMIAVGALLISGGAEIAESRKLAVFAAAAINGDIPWKAISAIAIAGLLAVAARRGGVAVLPVVCGAVMVAFHAVRVLADIHDPALVASGWLSPALTAASRPGSWSLLLSVPVDWNIVLSAWRSYLSIALICSLALLLSVTALELSTRQRVDVDQELRAAGTANLVTALCGGAAGYHDDAVTAMLDKSLHADRITVLVAALLCAGAALFDPRWFAYVPLPLLGGVLMWLGWQLWRAWMFYGGSYLHRADWIAVAGIVLVTLFSGFIAGVLLGIGVGIALFLVDYSQVSTIRYAVNGREIRSNVDRSPQAEQLLYDEGRRMQVIKLQGYLFFARAHQVLVQLEPLLTGLDASARHFAVLDFNGVAGIDSTATMAFVRLKQMAADAGVTLVFTGLGMEARVDLAREELADGQIHYFPSLDQGLAWCEEKLLEAAEIADGALVSAASVFDELVRLSSQGDAATPYLREIHVAAGETLIENGAPATDIFLVVRGALSVQVHGVGKEQIVLRGLEAGSVFGEMALYLGGARSAAVVAESDAVVRALSNEALTRLERDNPMLATEVHKLLARLLATKLRQTNTWLSHLR